MSAAGTMTWSQPGSGGPMLDLQTLTDAYKRMTRVDQPWRMTRRKARRMHRTGNAMWRFLTPNMRSRLGISYLTIAQTIMTASATTHRIARSPSTWDPTRVDLKDMYLRRGAVQRALRIR